LSKLRYLDLRSNLLHSLPESFKELRELEWLNIAQNFPDIDLCFLLKISPHLKTKKGLEVSLVDPSLPSSYESLLKTESLNLSNKHLTQIPFGLGLDPFPPSLFETPLELNSYSFFFFSLSSYRESGQFENS